MASDPGVSFLVVIASFSLKIEIYFMKKGATFEKLKK